METTIWDSLSMVFLKVLGNTNGVMVPLTKEISNKVLEVGTEVGKLVKTGSKAIKVTILQTRKKVMGYILGIMAGFIKETFKTTIETVTGNFLTHMEIYPTKANGKMATKFKKSTRMLDTSLKTLSKAIRSIKNQTMKTTIVIISPKQDPFLQPQHANMNLQNCFHKHTIIKAREANMPP